MANRSTIDLIEDANSVLELSAYVHKAISITAKESTNRRMEILYRIFNHAMLWFFFEENSDSVSRSIELCIPESKYIAVYVGAGVPISAGRIIDTEFLTEVFAPEYILEHVANKNKLAVIANTYNYSFVISGKRAIGRRDKNYLITDYVVVEGKSQEEIYAIAKSQITRFSFAPNKKRSV